MVRKGASVRVRQRALRTSLLRGSVADLPDAADAAWVVVKVPRRYRAGRDGIARFADHVDRGAPRKALELLEDARVVPQARGRRVPELGRELDDVDALVDEQAREAAAQIPWAGVSWHAGRDRHRLEDPLAPVFPIAPGPPLAAGGGEDEALIGRRTAEPPAAQVAGERLEQPGLALDYPAGLGRAERDCAPANLVERERQRLGLRPGPGVREHRYERCIQLSQERVSHRDAPAAPVAAQRRIQDQRAHPL